MEEGDRVIVRSNEDEPYQLGTFVEYMPMHSIEIPVVKFDRDGKNYFCMGIVRPYSVELEESLQTMKPKEQWDYLKSRPT
jgi:hypothetical protein